jgi:hypothetical protein
MGQWIGFFCLTLSDISAVIYSLEIKKAASEEAALNKISL